MDTPEEKHMNKIELKVHGTTCGSCEVLIERKWRKLPGAESVQVNHTSGHAVLHSSRIPPLEELQAALGEKYTVAYWHDRHKVPSHHQNTRRDYLEIGAAFLILFALYLLLKQFNVLPEHFTLSENMGYGVAFGMGIIAAISTCLAVTGGLLVAVSAKHAERHPELSGFRKFKPHIYFNIGRIISYTVLGAAIGAVGSAVTLSPQINGMLTVLVSIIMIFLGLQLLNLLPSLRRFHIKMPKFLAHKIYEASDKEHPAAAFLLGGATFFLPCGFTQALQLWVLSRGDAVTGALTMLAFSLGTLPALVSLGAASSFAKGAWQRYFMKFAAVLVIALGFFSVGNGIVLAGGNFDPAALFRGGEVVAAEPDANVRLAGGKQIVEMRVEGLEYLPSQFTVLQGVPVEWRIDGRNAQGCAQVITVPKLGITEYLPRDQVKVITFTPGEAGRISFSCTMGMTTRGAAFNVIPGTGEAPTSAAPAATEPVCDPTTADCNVQRLQMEITRERGFSPREFTVRKGIPVELEIDAKVQLGGCMSTMIIPEYNVAHSLKLGKSVLRFTPTAEGVVPFTCSMGSKMGQFVVTN